MRYALVLSLVLGMAPGVGELAEAVVHLVTAGHLAHSDADHGDLGDQGSEHGCGTTQHRCGCCVSQAVTLAPLPAESRPAAADEGRVAADVGIASLHEPMPPRRPPIAS